MSCKRGLNSCLRRPHREMQITVGLLQKAPLVIAQFPVMFAAPEKFYLFNCAHWPPSQYVTDITATLLSWTRFQLISRMQRRPVRLFCQSEVSDVATGDDCGD